MEIKYIEIVMIDNDTVVVRVSMIVMIGLSLSIIVVVYRHDLQQELPESIIVLVINNSY